MDGITFELCDVKRGPLLRTLDVETSVHGLLAKPVEAWHCEARGLVACDTRHPLAKAMHDAFYKHLPLVLRPDDVWFCIAQGFATHVNLHAESLRERFVSHQGKLRLRVERPDFVLGRPNPWPEAFEAFSQQIGGHVGKLRELVCARFSTSTPTEIAAFDVTLMDAFQGYFEYQMMIGCEIPQITLRGTVNDWAAMIPRVRHLSEYGLEHWTRELVPVLEQFVATASGKPDLAFWRSMFRYQSGSGPAELTGWILTLYPYIYDDRDDDRGQPELVPNTYLDHWHERFWLAKNRSGFQMWDNLEGPWIGRLPSGLTSAPVRCEVPNNRTVDLRFVGGMFGVEQNQATGSLAPCFGWAIVHDSCG